MSRRDLRTRFAERLERSGRSLRIRNYRLFFTGNTVSLVGTWMQRVAQDWLIFEITDSPMAIGIALALQFGPILLFGIWGGVIADRVNGRVALVITQVAQLVLALLLGVLAALGVVELWMVYLLALLLGVVTVVDQPVRQAFVAELVDRDSYANAQVLFSTAHNLGKFIGPAIAGAVIAWQGVAAAFLINALSFVAMLVVLAMMHRGDMLERPRLTSTQGQAKAGVLYVWRHPQLRIAMVLLIVVSVMGQNFRVVFPLLGAYLGGDVSAYGTLMAVLGLGALLAAFATAARETATVRGLVLGSLAFGVASCVLAGSPVLGFALVVTVVVGAINFVFNTQVRTVLLLESDPAMQGRVMALHGLVFLGSTPIGSLIIGWVCEQWGVRIGLLAGGVSVLLSAVLAIWMSRRASEFGADGSESPAAQAGEADVAERSTKH